jgi:CheY-like chemotaxis protein
VVGVGDGREAVEYASRLLPDLIVMDLGLPGMDGCEATRALKTQEATRHIPVIALSGFADQAWAARALRSGCEAFLEKPCSTDQLLGLIDRLVARNRQVILVVEDDEAIRAIVTEVLTEEGFDVAGARDGREALEYLHAHRPPKLILLDLMMPVMNGWQFREAQMGDPRLAPIPVVVLTAAAGAFQQAASLEVTDVLCKPLDMPTLLSAIGRLT